MATEMEVFETEMEIKSSCINGKVCVGNFNVGYLFLVYYCYFLFVFAIIFYKHLLFLIQNYFESHFICY